MILDTPLEFEMFIYLFSDLHTNCFLDGKIIMYYKLNVKIFHYSELPSLVAAIQSIYDWYKSENIKHLWILLNRNI